VPRVAAPLLQHRRKRGIVQVTNTTAAATTFISGSGSGSVVVVAGVSSRREARQPLRARRVDGTWSEGKIESKK
jgi:hypothetical protein